MGATEVTRLTVELVKSRRDPNDREPKPQQAANPCRPINWSQVRSHLIDACPFSPVSPHCFLLSPLHRKMFSRGTWHLHPSRAKKGIKNGLRTKWPANNIISCIQQAGATLLGRTHGTTSPVPLQDLSPQSHSPHSVEDCSQGRHPLASVMSSASPWKFPGSQTTIEVRSAHR